MLYPVAGQRCVYTRLYRSIPALAIELTSTLERGEDWKHCAQLKRKWQIKWKTSDSFGSPGGVLIFRLISPTGAKSDQINGLKVV